MAAELQTGYTGRLRDAGSTNPEDKERILGELAASGVEEDVDSAIQVLLESGASTPTLREAVRRTGALEHAFYWNLSLLLLFIGGWCWLPLNRGSLLWAERHSVCPDGPELVCSPLWSHYELWLIILAFLEAMAWLLCFCMLPMDMRGFACRAMVRFFGTAAVLVFIVPLLTMGVSLMWVSLMGAFSIASWGIIV